MLVPAALKVPWSLSADKIEMHFYYIKCIPIPVDRNYREFGMFIKAPIPKEAEKMEVDLHLAHGRIVKAGFVPLGTVTLDRKEVNNHIIACTVLCSCAPSCKSVLRK